MSGLALAQQGAFSRKILQDKDLSIPNQHVVQAHAEFGPGAASGRHTHPGDEILYILEGELVVEVDGKPTTTLKAGDFAFIPAGVVHEGKNTSSGSAKVLATYVLEKGKPVATPAK
jgi:quercetin dioxygenase-like cupin family protein